MPKNLAFTGPGVIAFALSLVDIDWKAFKPLKLEAVEVKKRDKYQHHRLASSHQIIFEEAPIQQKSRF